VSATRPLLRIGILGVGTIGQMIAAALDAGDFPMTLVAVADQDLPLAQKFVTTLKNATPIVPIEELVRRSDLVVEAASQAALPEIVPLALEHRRDLLIMSVGGLLGHEEWFEQAAERGCRIQVPSGAIGGLDALKAARRGRLDSVILTSRKPVAALRGTKYVVENDIELDALKEDTVIFEGRPEQACRVFPTTSNVAASLRLAVGADANVCVRIMAAPKGTRNVHEIRARGDFGELHLTTENLPSESNPRTSRLAALSALATLDGIARSLRVGT
jgi:aspartate dehydrogenase